MVDKPWPINTLGPATNDAVEALLKRTRNGYITYDFEHDLEALKDVREIACGYDSGKGPSKIPIAPSLHYYRVGEEDDKNLTDWEFSLCQVFTDRLGHSSTSQPGSVADQPPCVTFLMNGGRGNKPKDSFVSSRIVRGAAEFLLERADCLLGGATDESPNPAALHEVLRERILLLRKQQAYSGSLGMSTDEQRALVRVSRSILAEAYSAEALAAAAELPHHGALPWWAKYLWIPYRDLGILWSTTMADRPVKGALTHKSYKHPLCYSPERRVLAALTECCEGPEKSAETVLQDVATNSTDAFLQADHPLHALAVALSELPSRLRSGGYSQREEGRRMSAKGWPHILHSKTKNSPVSVGLGLGFGKNYFVVRGLRTSMRSSFPMSYAEARELLFDKGGCFLPFEEAVSNLEERFNHFPDTVEENEELVEFADEQPFTFEAFVGALDSFGVDANRFHSPEVCTYTTEVGRLDEEGATSEERVVEFTFGIGPDEYTAWYFPGCGGATEGEEALEEIAAARIYDAFDDYSQQCWMTCRGLLEEGQEIRGHGSSPDKLSESLRQDFVDWCHEAVSADGPWHELNSYDGSGSVEASQSTVFAIWRSG